MQFPSRLNDETPFNSVSRAKDTFYRQFSIAPYTLNDLRRTFSSTMAKLGTPIHVIEKILNHVSGTISGAAAVYNRHSYQTEMHDAFATYETHLFDATQDLMLPQLVGGISHPFRLCVFSYGGGTQQQRAVICISSIKRFDCTLTTVSSPQLATFPKHCFKSFLRAK